MKVCGDTNHGGKLQQIMVAEQDSEVKNMLKLNGLYVETTE